MKKDIDKWINISERELMRDIVNLNLPEADITPGELNCYDDATEAWLKSGRKGKPSDYKRK